MPTLKTIKTDVNGKSIVFQVPDKRTVILKSRLSQQLLYIVESLLANDFTDYYKKIDMQYGLDYEERSGASTLQFTDGVLVGSERTVKSEGVIPKIHCIRYIGGYCKSIRSFLLSTESGVSSLYTDLTSYTTALPDSQWFRLIALVNSVVGYEMCSLKDRKLMFDFDSGDIDEEGCKLVYSLIAECFLTPEGYHRILLLSDIMFLYPEVQLNLLRALHSIKGHSLTLSSAKIPPMSLIDIPGVVLTGI